MRIQSISVLNKNLVNQNVCKPSFKGVHEVISNKLISSFEDSEQGTFEEYEEVIEYKPYKDETQDEINAEVAELAKDGYNSGCDGGPASAWEAVIRRKVIIGKRLDCTKEAAEAVLKHSKIKV